MMHDIDSMSLREVIRSHEELIWPGEDGLWTLGPRNGSGILMRVEQYPLFGRRGLIYRAAVQMHHSFSDMPLRSIAGSRQ
jgi:hypothetical protein